MPVSVARVRTYMQQSQKGLARHTVRTTDDVAWSRIMSCLVLSWSVLSNLVYLEYSLSILGVCLVLSDIRGWKASNTSSSSGEIEGSHRRVNINTTSN